MRAIVISEMGYSKNGSYPRHSMMIRHVIDLEGVDENESDRLND